MHVHPEGTTPAGLGFSRLTDGCVMCCLCFEYFQPGDLWRDEAGVAWDVCPACRAIEQAASSRASMDS